MGKCKRSIKTNKAVITNRSQNLQAGELSTIQLSWKALGWVDELVPSEPQGTSGATKIIAEGTDGIVDRSTIGRA